MTSYDIGTHKAARLPPGMDLRDYTLTVLTGDGLAATVSKLCLSSVKDWEIFPENKPLNAVTVKLP